MKKIITLSLLLFCARAIKAQSTYNDFQVWENIYLEKNLSKKFVAHLNHEGRITENATQFRYGYADFGVTWKFKKAIRFSADYVLLFKKTFNNENTGLVNSIRHQFYITATLRKKLNKVSLSDRNRLQWEWDDIVASVNGLVPQLYYRNKLTAKYDLGNNFAHYLAMEQYYSFISYDKYGHQFDRGRYYAGLFYQLNAVNELEGYFMMERHYDVNHPQVNWVLGFGFSHAFYGGLMGKW